MKNLKLVLVTAVLAIFASCSDNENIEELINLQTKTVNNLYAPAEGRGNYTGDFTKFSFHTGATVEGDNWDIAFRATEIIVNGGEKGKLLEDIDRTGEASLSIIPNTTFNDVTEAPSDETFKQDRVEALALPVGSSNGWYNYNPTNHGINPIAGVVLVVKTIEGNYAKMEITTYYKDGDATNPENGRHYTFNYQLNPEKGKKKFQ
ncbi:HmuY family protein [Tenacibaculum crassostreae]|uniref:HmuY family protein n=1 Tax=Tenacibaculum crassostreae TaxID=502683 RepID=UPI0038956759